MINIYALYAENENNIRYIGRTKKSPEKRLGEHIRDIFRKRTKTVSWIKSCLKKGIIPKVILIDQIEERDKEFWEYHYISLYRSWGFNLTNDILDPNNQIKYIKKYQKTKEYKLKVFKKVILEDIKTGKQLRFNSIKEAGDYLNCKPDKVSAVLNQRKSKKIYKSTGTTCIITRKTIKGYKVLLDTISNPNS